MSVSPVDESTEEGGDDDPALTAARERLGTLLGDGTSVIQLQELAKTPGAHEIVIELQTSVDGCARLERHLRACSAFSFVSQIMARRRNDVAGERARDALTASVNERVDAVLGGGSCVNWWG